MFKKIVAFITAMAAFAAFAAVDVNKASESELDGIKGIGPATSRVILAERKKGEFKSWDDFIARVKGVGETNAAKFSTGGLTVAGASYSAPAATGLKIKAEKPSKANVAASNANTEAVKPAAIAASEAGLKEKATKTTKANDAANNVKAEPAKSVTSAPAETAAKVKPAKSSNAKAESAQSTASAPKK